MRSGTAENVEALVCRPHPRLNRDCGGPDQGLPATTVIWWIQHSEHNSKHRSEHTTPGHNSDECGCERAHLLGCPSRPRCRCCDNPLSCLLLSPYVLVDSSLRIVLDLGAHKHVKVSFEFAARYRDTGCDARDSLLRCFCFSLDSLSCSRFLLPCRG
jgi:hypothetical protein